MSCSLVGLSKGYGSGSSWPPGDPYGGMPPGMQRSTMGGGGGGGHMGPGSYPMGLSHDHQLRMHQEQMMHAQQARRMQQQQAVAAAAAAGGGGMYGMPPQQPQGPGMMGPPMSHPPQGGMPPGYPQPNVPPGKPSGNRQTSKMH